MLIPLDNYTNQLWLVALQDNARDIQYAWENETPTPYNLNNWLVNKTVTRENDEFQVVFLSANERDQKKNRPTYFEWVRYSINLQSIPHDLQNQWPPSITTMNKYGERGMNGGLMNTNGNWSSHT